MQSFTLLLQNYGNRVLKPLHVTDLPLACIWGASKHHYATLGFQCLIERRVFEAQQRA